jgi:hypothetical protein
MRFIGVERVKSSSRYSEPHDISPPSCHMPNLELREGIKSDPREAATSGGQDQGDVTSMAGSTVPPCSGAVQIAALLDSPEIDQLVAELQATRQPGSRDGRHGAGEVALYPADLDPHRRPGR